MRLFAGYDPREALGFHVFVESLIRSSLLSIGNLALTPLFGPSRDGTNSFTYERFRVPELCGFEGMAVFVDGSDMLLRSNIRELQELYEPHYAVQVVQHHYSTRHPRKYIGTTMESDNRPYPCKNWSSVVLWNCGHPSNQILTSPFIAEMPGSYLHRFGWLQPQEIGTLPAEWNLLVGEEDTANPKLVHYTLGIPSIPHYQDCDYAEDWHTMRRLLQDVA